MPLPNQNERVEAGHKITLRIRDKENKSGRDGQEMTHIVSADDYTKAFIGRTLGEDFVLRNHSEEAGMRVCPVTLTEIALP